MSCLYFCALSLEAKESRFICYKLITPQRSDDGLKDETGSFELGVALALLHGWVWCRLHAGLAGLKPAATPTSKRTLQVLFQP